MRRLLPFALIAAFLVAGCGSSSSHSASSALSNAREAELSYFPAGTPLIMSATTDPKSTQIGNLNQLLGHFPIVAFGEQALLTKISQLGLNYQTEIKPLLGEPISLGVVSTSGLDPSNVLVVFTVSDAAKLQALLAKLPGLAKGASVAGATVYSAGGATVAIDGPTLIFGEQTSTVDDALQRHANHTGFSTSEYEQLLSGLPSDSLLQIFGDLGGVLSGSSVAKARQIPWVGAIKGYGVTVDAEPSSVQVHFRVDTTGAQLTDAQLPLSSSASTPGVAGSLPISVGIAKPSQAVTFILAALKDADPAELTKVPPGGLTAIDQLQSQLTGNAYVSSNGAMTMFRAQLANPTTAATTMQTVLGLAKPKPTSLGGGFYQSGSTTFGISGGELLVGKATTDQLKAFATAATSPVSGAQGSVDFQIQLLPLLQAVLHHSSGIIQTILSQLGAVTGSATVTPSALSGQASLSVH